jgi:hypothetical protein
MYIQAGWEVEKYLYISTNPKTASTQSYSPGVQVGCRPGLCRFRLGWEGTREEGKKEVGRHPPSPYHVVLTRHLFYYGMPANTMVLQDVPWYTTGS